MTDTTQPIALADLAEDVAVRENEKPLVEIPKEEVRAIRASLYHVHVPKLADAGAVDYDPNRNLVRIGDSADVVERVLSLGADAGNER